MKNSALLYVLLVVLLFFMSRWIIEGAYFRKDLVNITTPLENLYATIQRSGESPLWAPELSGGYPLLAVGQLGFWYPPHMLLRQFFPAVITLNTSLLLHALLAATGTFFFLRHNKISQVAAAAGAILVPLGSTFVGKYESLNLVLPFMWVPLALLLIQLFIEQGKHFYFIAWVLSNVLLVLVGHPQMTINIFLLEALFIVCLLVLHKRFFMRALLLLGGIFLVVGLTSFYLVPILDALPDTDRASGTLRPNKEGLFDNQFTPAAFLGLIVPHPFGHHDTYQGPPNENELSSYFGPLVLVVALIGLFSNWRKYPVLWWFSVLLVVVGLSLAIGGYSPLFRWLVNHGAHYFNAPARFFFYTHIGIVIFMVLGVEACRVYVMQKPRLALVVYVALFAALGSALWVSWGWHEGVSWQFTREPAVVKLLQAQPGTKRIIAAQKIATNAPSNDFGIKAWNPVCDTCVYRQSFISPFEKMNGLAIKVSNPKPVEGLVILKIYTAAGELLRESTTSTAHMLDSEWSNFSFETIEDSKDTEFYFELSSNLKREHAPQLLIHTNRGEQYDPSGKLLNCTKGGCTEVGTADAAFSILVDSEVVEYYEALAPYVSAGFGIGSMQWYGSLPLMHSKEYNRLIGTWGDSFAPGARTMINRFATSHILGLFPPYRYAPENDGLFLVDSVQNGNKFLRVYRNEQAFPRVHFASTVKAVADPVDQMNLLLSLDEKIVVADIQSDQVFTASEEAVKVIKDERTQVDITTNQKTEGFLVVRDILLKGWVATVDGSPTKIHRVDGIFRGIVVPAGEHTVSFQYKPAWVRKVVYIESLSILAFTIVVGYAIIFYGFKENNGSAGSRTA